MGVRINGQEIAEASASTVNLQSIIGGYELVFALRLNVSANADV